MSGTKKSKDVRFLLWDGEYTHQGSCTRRHPDPSPAPVKADTVVKAVYTPISFFIADYYSLPHTREQTSLEAIGVRGRGTVWSPIISVRLVRVTAEMVPFAQGQITAVEIELKRTKLIQALLFRVEDKNGQPVYQEVLDAGQILSLHDTDPSSLYSPPSTLPTRRASVEHSPYTISVWVSKAPGAFASCLWDGGVAPGWPDIESDYGIQVRHDHLDPLGMAMKSKGRGQTDPVEIEAAIERKRQKLLAGVGPGKDQTSAVGGRVVTAEAGDTLCGIAAMAHHPSCGVLRAHPRNSGLAGRKLRDGDQVFVPDPPPTRDWTDKVSVQVRFVKGTGGADADLTALHISNFVTDKCGADGTVTLPNDQPVNRGPSEDALADEDVFKVEVVDPLATPDDLTTASLLALRPGYDGHGVHDGSHSLFPDTAHAKSDFKMRRLDVGVSRQTTLGAHVFRSGYLRLVADDSDKLKRAKQTLLVTDMVKRPAASDRANPPDPFVEILDQKVRALYLLHGCPAPPAERCEVSLDLGLDPTKTKTVDLAVRILRPLAAMTGDVTDGLVTTNQGTAGDNGVCTLADTARILYTNVRQIWAQAHVKLKLVKLETVDPPSDMLAIGDWAGTAGGAGLDHSGLHLLPNAPPATGDYHLRFDVHLRDFAAATTTTHAIGPVTIPGGSTPAVAAQAIVDAVHLVGPLSGIASVSVNPAQGNNAGRKSADVLFKPPAGKRVTLAGLAGADDAAQTVHLITIDPSSLTLSNFPEAYHIASPQNRAITKALDSGGRNLDMVFASVGPMNVASGGQSSGFGLGALADFPADHQTSAEMKNSILMSNETVQQALQFLIAHEIGHVLIDTASHVLPAHKEQLMYANPGESTVHKRILSRDPAAPNWDAFQLDGTGLFDVTGTAPPISINAVARVHGRPGTILY